MVQQLTTVAYTTNVITAFPGERNIFLVSQIARLRESDILENI